MAIDFDDAEYVWPPGVLAHEASLTGPQIAGMRMDSIETRLANVERAHGELERQIADMAESVHVAVDAMTYIAGAVERVREIIRQRGAGE